MKLRRAALATIALVVVAAPFVGGSTAYAHPLGNFSVNHLDALTFEATRVVNDAVVDIAEIPTAQNAPSVDADGDGEASAAELEQFGVDRCNALASAQSLSVDGVNVAFSVERSSFRYGQGQASLPTSRLECRLVADADLATQRTIEFANSFESDRVGWREITAVGNRVAIIDSPVATVSVTDGLRVYPVDLLSSPMDIRAATFQVRPDATTLPATNPVDETTSADTEAIDRVGGYSNPLSGTFDDLVARRDLTVGVGLLAIGLAMVLGASHALLPGHGKTVMAAYIAGRQGSIGDAVMVGATVTATHTGGVLLLGLALTVSTSLAGEVVLGWLGVSSGVLVAALGAALLFGLIRRHLTGRPSRLHGHSHGTGFGQHQHHFGHDPDDPDGHDPDHGVHDHDHDVHDHDVHDHDHPHVHHGDHDHDGHDDHDHDGHDHGSVPQRAMAIVSGATVMEAAGASSADRGAGTAVVEGREPTHSHEALPDVVGKPFSRRGLIGMGVAGGLVPSPSALIILLSAISLGRTAFGAVLVVAYGLGMALTLTLAGIALVVLRDRYQRRMQNSSGRLHSTIERWVAIAPYATATLVIVVGIGLTVRSLTLL